MDAGDVGVSLYFCSSLDEFSLTGGLVRASHRDSDLRYRIAMHRADSVAPLPLLPQSHPHAVLGDVMILMPSPLISDHDPLNVKSMFT